MNKIEKKIILNQPPTPSFAADLSGVLILRMGLTRSRIIGQERFRMRP